MADTIYEWTMVGDTSPLVFVHKTSGNVYINAIAYQMLGYPRAIDIYYDETNNAFALMGGLTHWVNFDSSGRMYISALDTLEECGFTFPLANNYEAEPTSPGDSRNILIITLG